METGWMKDRLELYQPCRVRNKYGEEYTKYTKTATAYAYRMAQRGQRQEEVDEHFPAYSMQFVVRREHEVEENWRVKHVGGHLYTVTNVLPYGHERAYITLQCERVNE